MLGLCQRGPTTSTVVGGLQQGGWGPAAGRVELGAGPASTAELQHAWLMARAVQFLRLLCCVQNGELLASRHSMPAHGLAWDQSKRRSEALFARCRECVQACHVQHRWPGCCWQPRVRATVPVLQVLGRPGCWWLSQLSWLSSALPGCTISLPCNTVVHCDAPQLRPVCSLCHPVRCSEAHVLNRCTLQKRATVAALSRCSQHP